RAEHRVQRGGRVQLYMRIGQRFLRLAQRRFGVQYIDLFGLLGRRRQRTDLVRRQHATRIVAATLKMNDSSTSLWNRSLIELTKIILGSLHRRASQSLYGPSLRSKPCSNGCPFTPLKRSANLSA